MVRSYEKISHGVSEEHPFRLKRDRWEEVGPGRRDMHYEVELGMVRRGRMRREFGSVTRTLGEGDLWLQGIWEPHSADVLAAPLELLIIHISPAVLANLSFREAPQVPWLLPFTLTPDKRPCGAVLPKARAKRHIAELSRLDPDAAGAEALPLRFRALELLLDVLRFGNIGKAAGAEPSFSSRLDRVLDYVLQRRGRVSAQETAKRFGLSRNGFNLFFRRCMGISFAKFSLHQRLSGAAGDLVSGTDPVKAIGQEWGFCDVSHFYQRFREAYGCTPVEYRGRKSAEASS